MASERLIAGDRHGCLHMDSDQPPEPARSSSFFAFDQSECGSARIFEELPRATIVQFSIFNSLDELSGFDLLYIGIELKVKDWLQNLGIGDHAPVLQEDDEAEDVTVPLHVDESAKNRDVPSSAALEVIRPALGRQHSISDRAKVAMQGYLNHFLGNLDIVNSHEGILEAKAENVGCCNPD
ncbi:hypothetical protein Cgig2_000548 [Carnegiea gigantea]|uniref:Uncharacterized protein n=1 Tax=Carnegiea gigantea TaxID=171969 RepID=A0A9Q1GQC2_9CARY|nr:hypothetical protein Cgig2_000548 [Carnegiea gigantea]